MFASARKISAQSPQRLSISAKSPASSDLDIVRSRVLGYWTAANVDRADPDLAPVLAALSASAKSALEGLQPDGRWADIDYAVSPATGWPAQAHFQRLRTLAQAYATPGQPLHQAPALGKAVERALR